jgi:hypothetical protein
MEYQKMVLIPIEQYNHWKNLTVTTHSVEGLSKESDEMLLAKTSTSDIPLHEKKSPRKINNQGKKDIVNKKRQKILPGVKQVINKKRLLINNKKKKTSIKPVYIKKKVLPLEGRALAASFWTEEWIKL